jgi:hypothetical protein
MKPDSADDFRRRAAMVREIPLETVLIYGGAVRDRQDRSKWHTERGLLSVTGCQFMNWQQGTGGGGAIDLVMHLGGMNCVAAVRWLEQHVAWTAGAIACGNTLREPPPQGTLASPQGALETGTDSLPSLVPCRLPPREDRMWGRVHRYLVERRYLSASLLEPLWQSGRLYADFRANAVFVLMAGKAHRPVGAELRGTGPRIWRGMAGGTRKDWGYFWTGLEGSRKIVLCESAVDAISCYQMHGDCISISTCGVRTNPRWLPGLITRGYEIWCGFDTDAAGDTAAAGMMELHPSIQRLRPPSHDWNDALATPRHFR